jgi:hypothetical protein
LGVQEWQEFRSAEWESLNGVVSACKFCIQFKSYDVSELSGKILSEGANDSFFPDKNCEESYKLLNRREESLSKFIG